MGNNLAILGIDIGGTDCKYGVVDRQGNVLFKSKEPTRVDLGPEKVIDLIAAHAKEIATKHEFGCVGVGVPGPMSSRLGVVFESPNLGWVNVPVRDMLAQRLGRTVAVNNDANAAAYGEFWAGAGKGAMNMILFTLGTGVGGGIIVNGKLYGGPDDTAGELGHMIINFEGPPCNCGARGCLEAYASATAIKRMVREALAAGRVTSIPISTDPEAELGAKEVYEAAAAGDALAQEIVDLVAYTLGVGAANIINTFNPDLILYGGAMANAGEVIFGPLRETAKKLAFDKPFQRARIEKAALGADAGIIGAAGLALHTQDEKGAVACS